MNNKYLSKIISGSLLCTITLYTIPVMAYTKDETVYSKIDNEGKNYKTIVSTHLKNTQDEEILKDISDLLNIKNTNGEETFEQSGKNIKWNANKHDIYYQGETTKQLPIECNVKYQLDGKEISANDIAGKSGKVKVIIEYKNKDEHMVKVNGKDEKLYTPFVVVAGTIIENENNKNINITNGKVIDDGTKTILLGIALPGLQESLKISEKEVQIPNSIEISMETTSFEMGSIMSFATPKIIQDEDLDIIDNLEKIYSKTTTLQTSANQLEEGANTLKEGTNTYSKKMHEFKTAMEQITNGMNNANTQYTKINEGIKTLNESSTKLNDGAKQVSEGIELVSQNLSIISQKLQEAQSGAIQLSGGQKELVKGIDTLLKQLESINGTDNQAQIQQLTQLVQKNSEAIQNLQNANLALSTIEQNETIQAQIEANTSIIALLQANNIAQNNIITALKATDTTSITALKEALQQIKTGLNALNAGASVLENGITALSEGANTLCSKTQELSVGASTLYQGTSKLGIATITLNAGSKQIKQGLNTLDNSGALLLNANNQLEQGAITLNEGATKLSDGMSTFNKEGIQKICDFVNGNLKNNIERVEKLAELSKQYSNFTMLEDGVEGEAKFVMIIDAIKEHQEQETTKEKIITDNKENVTR